MKRVLFGIVWTVVGLIVALVVIIVIQLLSALTYPSPADLNMNDRQAMADYVATLPVGALLFVLASYLAGTLAGSWLATRFVAGRHPAGGIAVGSLLLLAGIANMASIPHPMWFMVVCLAIFPLAAACGVLLARRNRPASTASSP